MLVIRKHHFFKNLESMPTIDKEQQAKQQLRDHASKDLKEWYERRTQTILQKKAMNRAIHPDKSEPSHHNSQMSENDLRSPTAASDHAHANGLWSKIAGRIDFQQRTDKDMSRMKGLLTSLVNDPQPQPVLGPFSGHSMNILGV